MTRKTSKIPSLLAARLRSPQRTPPGRAALSSGSHLRICRGDSEPAHNDLSPDYPPPAFDATAAAALRTDLEIAAVAIGSILDLLAEIKAQTSPDGVGRRRSPREIAELQSVLDRTLQRVDQIAASTNSQGTRLLDGGWQIRLPLGDRPGDSLNIGSMSTSELGKPISLAMLRREGHSSLARGSVAAANSSICSAMAQATTQQRQLLNFANRIALLAPGLMAVAHENHSAMQSAVSDADLAAITSTLTRGDAMLANLAQKSPIQGNSKR